MQNFRNLIVWQRSFDLAVNIYRSTEGFPAPEGWGLTAQIRRAGISIPSNIAEGCGRGSDPDFARCLLIAMGSANELECQILLATEIGMLSTNDFANLEKRIQEVKRLLSSLIRTVRPFKERRFRSLRFGKAES